MGQRFFYAYAENKGLQTDRSSVLLPQVEEPVWRGEVNEMSVSGWFNLTKPQANASATPYKLGGRHLPQPYSPHLNNTDSQIAPSDLCDEPT